MLKTTLKSCVWATVFGVAAIGGQALAQDAYPNKAITLIVPYGAGGTTDLIGRALAEGMGKHLNQTIVVENKPGAAGSMGANDMVNAKPDGYRITLAPAGIFRQPYLQKTRYDPIKDLTFISAFANYDFAIAVSPESPIQNIHDYVKFIQENPDKMDFGTPGRFTGNQVVMVELATAVKGKAVHVPFKSDSESISSLLGGQIQSVVSTNIILPFIQSGKVRVLATAAAERPAAFSQVPTLKEAGYDVVVPSPLGVAGPKDLPADVVAKLDEAIKATIETEKFQKSMIDYGVQIKYMDHKEYQAYAEKTFVEEKTIVERLGDE